MSEGVGALLLSQSEKLIPAGQRRSCISEKLGVHGSSGRPCLLSTGTDWELKVHGDHIYSPGSRGMSRKVGETDTYFKCT